MRFSPLLIIPMLALAACAQPGPQETGEQKPSSSRSVLPGSGSSLPPSDFHEADDETRGSAYVRGYTIITREGEPFCEKDCAMHDVVSFRVTETNSDGLENYLSKMGQSETSESRITLGCKEGEVIRYANQVGREMNDHTLDAGASRAILNATAEAPVILLLTKEPIAGGRGAPACYSHFTTVSVVASDNIDARPAVGEGCQVGGCSAEVCGEKTGEPIASNCIFKPEFACFGKAECKKQSDGKCGWTHSTELTSCLQNARTNAEGPTL